MHVIEHEDRTFVLVEKTEGYGHPCHGCAFYPGSKFSYLCDSPDSGVCLGKGDPVWKEARQ
jgi:hypothetical protein